MKGVLTAIVVALQFLTVVPPLLRRMATPDELGRANQTLAAAADTVVWMVAGLPVILKSDESTRKGVARVKTDASKVGKSNG